MNIDQRFKPMMRPKTLLLYMLLSVFGLAPLATNSEAAEAVARSINELELEGVVESIEPCAADALTLIAESIAKPACNQSGHLLEASSNGLEVFLLMRASASRRPSLIHWSFPYTHISRRIAELQRLLV